MSPHALFPLFNFGILAPWALLVFAPRWRWTQRIVLASVVILCVAYLTMLIFSMRTAPEGSGGQTLDGVMRLFGSPWLALVCWIHYLAFDMVAGAWIVRDAVKRNISHWLVAPCVILTLFFGPAGFLAYTILRALKAQGAQRLPVSQST
jgi:hypothetical protein